MKQSNVVCIRMYAHGYGWNWDRRKKVTDVVHACILAKKLGAGVTDPKTVMLHYFQKELSESDAIMYADTISQFDNAEATIGDVQKLRMLAEKLSMKVRNLN